MASETDWLAQYPEAEQQSWLDQYPEAKEKPFFDLSDTLSATGRAFTSLGTTLPASLSQSFEGLVNPWSKGEESRKRRESMQALQQEMEDANAAAQASGDLSSVSFAIRGATPSLGPSFSTLGPSLLAGAATGLATKSPAAARSAAAGTSLLMAYRMAGAQFLDDARDRIDNFFQEQLQRPLTPEEQNEAYEELLPLARKFGAAEAGPEALGNLALGGAGKYIRKVLGGKNGIMDLASNALSKVTGAKAVAAGVGAAAGEVGTEAITAVEQDRINQELEQSVLRGESPESVVLPDRTIADYAQAVPNVAPETLAMTSLMGLAGLGPTAINRGYRALRPQAESAQPEAELPPSEVMQNPGLAAAVQTADSIVTTAENTSDNVSKSVEATRNLINGVVANEQNAQATKTQESGGIMPESRELPVLPEQPLTPPQEAPVELPVEPAIEPTVETPSPAMEQPEKSSQTITDSNGEIAPEMSVPPPTAEAGAGVGEAIQAQDENLFADERMAEIVAQEEADRQAMYELNGFDKTVPANKLEKVVGELNDLIPDQDDNSVPIKDLVKRMVDGGATLQARGRGTVLRSPNGFEVSKATMGETGLKYTKFLLDQKAPVSPLAEGMERNRATIARAAEINRGTKKATPSTNEFVQKMTGQQPTPQGAVPTPATEGKVMPGGSATERGIKPPKVGNVSAIPTPEEEARWKAVDDFTTPYVASLSDEALDSLGLKVGVKRNGVADDAYRTKILGNTHPDDLLDAIPEPISPQTNEVAPIQSPISGSVQSKDSKAATTKDSGGEASETAKVGEQSPQTTASETQTPAPSRKGAGASGVASTNREGGRSAALEPESPVTAIESTEKTDVAKDAMSFLEADLTAPQRKVWTPEMFAAAQAFFDGGGKDFDSLKKAIKFPRVVQQAYLKADKDAAAEQSRREAAGAALAREVERAAKEQVKIEASELKRQELMSKTLNSLIEKTRTNVVQGAVKPADAQQAISILNKSGEIQNVLFTWIGTSKDFLADPENRVRYPETWKAVSANSNIEGMSENGQPIVFTDNVGVSDLDRKLANLQGTTPEVAAVRRVILHENIHKGMFFLNMKEKMKLFQFLHRLYSPEELDQLAKSYDEYADWRTNQVSYFSIIEEAMTRDFDSMVEIPRDGIWAEFMQFLREIWQKITGKTGEPKLKDYKDVFRLIRNSLKNSEKVNADRLKNGGAVRMSKGLSALFPRQATIQDAYRASSQGQSSQFISLSDVFAKAKEANPSLTEEAFKADVIRLYDSGAIYLEGANSTQEAESASLSIPGTSVGTAVRIAVPQPMASKVEFDSPNEAAFNSGAEVARNTNYDERDKAVRSSIRAAYDLAPKTNGPSVPLDQLFSIAKQSMPDLTEAEFSQILQDLYEDSGVLLQAGNAEPSPGGLSEALPRNITIKEESPSGELDAQTVREWADIWSDLSDKEAAKSTKSKIIKALARMAEDEGWNWGWQKDANAEFFPYIVYFDTPQGQVSFHTSGQMGNPYKGVWSEEKGASARVLPSLFPKTSLSNKKGTVTILGQKFEFSQRGKTLILENQDQDFQTYRFNEAGADWEFESESTDGVLSSEQEESPDLEKLFNWLNNATAPASQSGGLSSRYNTDVSPQGASAQMTGAQMFGGTWPQNGSSSAPKVNTESSRAAGGTFNVTTPDGQRAGSAIIMPPADMTKDDVTTMLRGMSAANPSPGNEINQELYVAVLARLRDFIAGRGDIVLPIQSPFTFKTEVYKPFEEGILSRELREDFGTGRNRKTGSGGLLPNGVQGGTGESSQDNTQSSEERNLQATEGFLARPNEQIPSVGFTLANYIQIASRLGASVETNSTKARNGLATLAEEDGTITIGLNAANLAQRISEDGLSENEAITSIGDALVEELIHAADLAVQREAWIASGKRGSFVGFSINHDLAMVDQMLKIVESSNDQGKASRILFDAIQASRKLYGGLSEPASIDNFLSRESPENISAVMSEFVRQMIQQDMHQTVSEASLFRRFIEHVMKVLQKIRDAIAPAKAGEFGDILKNRINETEMMLALAYQQTGSKASKVDPESAASKEFVNDIQDIESGSLKAAFKGRQLKKFPPVDHIVKPNKSYEQVAIDYVDAFLAEGGTLEQMTNSVIAPDFLAGIGIEDDVMARQALVAEVKNRIVNTGSKKKSKVEKKFFERLNNRISAFWQGVGTKSGRNQGQRAYIRGNPRYSWMFISDDVEKTLKDRRDNILIAQFGNDNATSFTQNSYENADKASTMSADEVAQDFVNNEEWDLIKEGEQVFEGGDKTLWERAKMLVRRFAFYKRRKDMKAANAKASMTDAERNELNAILQMSDDEADKAEAKDLAEFRSSMGKLLGEESPTDAPTEKTKRKKRKAIIDTVEKRVKAGQPIEAPDYVPIITENPQRDEMIEDVANSLLQVAKKRGVKPSQKTALADLVASIKSLLKANIKGEDLKADEAPLGQLLARTYLDNLTATEAKLFSESWNSGRKKVREMLAETGLEGAALEAELSAIMPATPTIAYNPSAVRKAITRALREATLDVNDLLENTQETKAEILKVWDKAAIDAGLTPANWKEGRKLAEKSIDEFIIERKAAKERSKQIAKAVAEQAKNPASLAGFSNSLAQFKIKPDRVRELFDQAKLLTKKRVQIANDQAVRVLFKAENKLAQSAFFDSATKPDTIVKAFREQVSDPMERKDFKARMEAMEVSSEIADKLFDKAARERDNAQWKRAQDMLEGPNALRNIIREISKARPGDKAPFSKQIPWKELLSKKASTVEEYRQRIFDAISANEELKSATPEQKARLADLFSEAWESNRKRILDSMLERMIREQEAKGDLSKKAAEALQEQRMRIVEDINLGIFDNDELAKIMAEKFGIKSEFTDAEREKIESLVEVLQDEKLNRVKRNKAAYELLETLSAQTDIPIAKLLANFWVSSVLSGMNTVFSIGMSVFSGMGELTTALSRIAETALKNPKQLPSEIAAAFKTLARVISAVPRQANRAWQYLVTGDQAFLDPTMNNALENMDWASIGKNNQFAEQMAKSDKVLEKSMGLFMRTVSRLLTALDLFNSGLTKEGSLSIVFRQLDLGPEAIAMLEKRSDLKAYKAQVIQNDFNGVAPKTLYEKALVDSYALAEMMKALDEIGAVSENADQMAMQGAMTLDPSGVGGYGYRAVKSLMKSAETGADKLLERNLRKWDEAKTPSDKAEAFVKLALSYIFQFAAYNAANLVGVRFARFAGNKFNQSLSFLPVLGALRLYEAEFDSDRVRGKEAFTDMIKRNQLMGVVFAAIGYQFLKDIADEPDDEERGWFINGGWSNLAPEKKQQKLASGQKEYTLGFDDTVINYGNWPGSGIIAAIGSLSDLIRFSPEQWSEKTVPNKLLSATTSGVFSAMEVPALSQFQELFGSSLSSKDPNEQKLTKFARVLGNYAGGFMPRILKDLDYQADQNLRKYETLWEKTASHIPVYRRYEGKEYYDILGQQIQRNIYPGSREFMSKPTDSVYKILGALNSRGIWLTPANAEHRMVGKGARRRKLTQEEADNYGLETGKGYKQMLLRYGQRALQMPTERARDFLLEKANDVRDKALKKVYRGYTPAS